MLTTILQKITKSILQFILPERCEHQPANQCVNVLILPEAVFMGAMIY